jgi:hypothetical protein
MANLIETIRKNLGFNELNKIDPNTQDVQEHQKVHGTDSLAQAAIPAILVGVYNNLQNLETASVILDGDSVNWLSTIFGNKKDQIIDKIATYGQSTPTAAKQEAEHIANEAVRVVRQNIPDHKNFTAVQTFVKENRNDTLKFLPASLQLGDLLNNNNIDDRTNKMEGPVSNFMHKLEKAFNSNE